MGVQWPEQGNVAGAPPAPLTTSAKPQFPGLLMWVVSVVWVAQASLPQAGFKSRPLQVLALLSVRLGC